MGLPQLSAPSLQLRESTGLLLGFPFLHRPGKISEGSKLGDHRSYLVYFLSLRVTVPHYLMPSGITNPYSILVKCTSVSRCIDL